MIRGAENGTSLCHLANFSGNIVFDCHFMAPHSGLEVFVATPEVNKMAENSPIAIHSTVGT